MTEQDYKIIAEAIKKGTRPLVSFQIEILIKRFCVELKKDNKMFNKEKFVEAIGLQLMKEKVNPNSGAKKWIDGKLCDIQFVLEDLGKDRPSDLDAVYKSITEIRKRIKNIV